MNEMLNVLSLVRSLVSKNTLFIKMKQIIVFDNNNNTYRSNIFIGNLPRKHPSAIKKLIE